MMVENLPTDEEKVTVKPAKKRVAKKKAAKRQSRHASINGLSDIIEQMSAQGILRLVIDDDGRVQMHVREVQNFTVKIGG